jgi:hypothetical protein
MLCDMSKQTPPPFLSLSDRIMVYGKFEIIRESGTFLVNHVSQTAITLYVNELKRICKSDNLLHKRITYYKNYLKIVVKNLARFSLNIELARRL